MESKFVQSEDSACQSLLSSTKPHLVISINCVFPDGEAKQVMGFDESNGNLAYSQVLVREIAGVLRACLCILDESLNQDNSIEVMQHDAGGKG